MIFDTGCAKCEGSGLDWWGGDTCPACGGVENSVRETFDACGGDIYKTALHYTKSNPGVEIRELIWGLSITLGLCTKR